MVRGLWRLVWLELKIFLREPLGAFGGIGLPVLSYLLIGRIAGGRVSPASRDAGAVLVGMAPVIGALLIGLTTAVSLVTIVAVYREAGILKRLRATPLRPWTILAAHVIVKLIFSAITLVAMVAAGRRYFPASLHLPLGALTAGLLIATLSILAIGFVIASVVPTARFAQPIATAVFYPMVVLSGLFFSVDVLPQALRTTARLLPLTYAVSLLRGIVRHDAWSAHTMDVTVLALFFVGFMALSARVFRWE